MTISAGVFVFIAVTAILILRNCKHKEPEYKKVVHNTVF